MSKFCAINIQNSHVVLLDVEKKGKNYSIVEYSVIDKSELPKHIKNKKNIFLSIEQDEVVDEKISIESVIKNDSVIRSIILRKLQESNPNERILFNYSPLPQNQNDEKTDWSRFTDEYGSDLSFDSEEKLEIWKNEIISFEGVITITRVTALHNGFLISLPPFRLSFRKPRFI